MSSSSGNGCLSLSGSRFCPQYSEFNVATAFATPKLNPTIEDFDNYINNTFSTNKFFSNSVKTFLNCADSNYTSENLRYLVSVNCALIVDTSASCNPTIKPLPLCKSVMSLFFTKFTQDLAAPNDPTSINPNVCKFDGSNSRNLLQTYSILFNNSALSDIACTPGTSIELLQCGFSNVSDATEYCKINSNELCCKSTVFGGNISDVQLLLPIPLASNQTTSTASFQPSTNTTGGTNSTEIISPIFNSSPVSSSPVVLGYEPIIILGVTLVTFVVLFSFGLCCCLLLKRKKAKYQRRILKFGSNLPVLEKSSLSGFQRLSLPANNDNNDDNFVGARNITETLQAHYDYVPNLSDEITLYVGDPVLIKQRFDDGWCLGYNMTTKEEGSFPIACVGPYNNLKKENYYSAQFSNRTSSLIFPK
ncbi:hypothetical protein HDU92_006739 [Lobulomyces angularis]|nr:hypothetical protein HDU92_006739 [Lobulomyces angularis]